MHAPKSSAHFPSLQQGAESQMSPRFWNALQTLPQLPQFSGSDCVSAVHSAAPPEPSPPEDGAPPVSTAAPPEPPELSTPPEAGVAPPDWEPPELLLPPLPPIELEAPPLLLAPPLLAAATQRLLLQSKPSSQVLSLLQGQVSDPGGQLVDPPVPLFDWGDALEQPKVTRISVRVDAKRTGESVTAHW
jgi:hypothetical protein